jgi:hypothetical protein
MSACCKAASRNISTAVEMPTGAQKPSLVARVRQVFAWAVPSVILLLVPKCPVCLAAHVAFWTGLGVSLSTAAYLRWGLLFLCVASLLFLIAGRLQRLVAAFGAFK